MSRDGSIELDFGDGTYKFRLPWGELVHLQESCGAGPYVVLQRLQNGTWHMDDIRESIRYGLIGGGTEHQKALKLVQEYVEKRPPVENVMFAQVVLSAALMGAPDEPVGEPEAVSQEEPILTTSQTGS